VAHACFSGEVFRRPTAFEDEVLASACWKGILRVIEHGRGAERSYELHVGRTADCGDVRTAILGELDGAGANRSRRAVDQDLLPWPNGRTSEEVRRQQAAVPALSEPAGERSGELNGAAADAGPAPCRRTVITTPNPLEPSAGGFPGLTRLDPRRLIRCVPCAPVCTPAYPATHVAGFMCYLCTRSAP